PYLSHTWNHLSSQFICALMCLNSWSTEGFVKSTDIQTIAALEEIEGDNDIELAQGWDTINVD
ncbi:hypothetical protein SCLCIDRAFT_134978, partial [Scleroderma citrinum Foug A]